MTISLNTEEPIHSMPTTRKDSVIIFDWDDTLMASSWVDREKLIRIDSFSSLPLALQTMFSKLEEHVAKCLRAARNLGSSVIIITNAEAGWVEYSSKRFMPRLIPILRQIRIVSARSTYGRFYPDSPLCWKAAAFAHEANVVFSQYDQSDHSKVKLSRQIISFGDSNEERTAVKIAAGQLDAVAKSIKFVDLPTPEQLIKQIETVTGMLTYVYDHNIELDLMMKPSDVDPQYSPKSNMPQAPVVPPVVAPVVALPDHEGGDGSIPYRPPALATLHQVV